VVYNNFDLFAKLYTCLSLQRVFFIFMLPAQNGWLSGCPRWGGRTRAFFTGTPSILRDLRIGLSRF